MPEELKLMTNPYLTSQEVVTSLKQAMDGPEEPDNLNSLEASCMDYKRKFDISRNLLKKLESKVRTLEATLWGEEPLQEELDRISLKIDSHDQYHKRRRESYKRKDKKFPLRTLKHKKDEGNQSYRHLEEDEKRLVFNA